MRGKRLKPKLSRLPGEPAGGWHTHLLDVEALDAVGGAGAARLVARRLARAVPHHPRAPPRHLRDASRPAQRVHQLVQRTTRKRSSAAAGRTPNPRKISNSRKIFFFSYICVF